MSAGRVTGRWLMEREKVLHSWLELPAHNTDEKVMISTVIHLLARNRRGESNIFFWLLFDADTLKVCVGHYNVVEDDACPQRSPLIVARCTKENMISREQIIK